MALLAFVMAGLVPAIHVWFLLQRQDVDAREKPGMTTSKHCALVPRKRGWPGQARP